MKIFKYFIILSTLIALSYFSWDYYAGRLNKGKYEKATLVFEDNYKDLEDD